MGVDPIPGLDLAWAKIRRSLKMGVLHMGPPYKWPEINGPHNCFFFFTPISGGTHRPLITGMAGAHLVGWILGFFEGIPYPTLNHGNLRYPPKATPPQEIATPNKALLKLKETNG